MKLTVEQIKAALVKHGSQVRAARALGTSRRRLRGVLAKSTLPASAPSPSQDGISASAFIGRFDYPGKLRAVVSRLCRARFISDSRIRAESEIPPVAYRAVAEQPEFRACQIKEGGQIWWSSKENVSAAREQAKKWGIQK
jgi:hypothetical protein